MKRLLLILILVFHAAMGGGALAQDEAERYVVSRDAPDWFKASFLDFGEDVAEAAAADKRVMIYFGQDGCPYCKKLHEDSFKNPETVRFITSRFDSVAVNMFGDLEAVWTDGDDSFSEKTLSAKLGIQFTPTLLFLDEEGMEVARVAGYQPPERFRAVLDYVAGRLERQGVSLESHMRERSRKSAGLAAPLPDSFARANGGWGSRGCGRRFWFRREVARFARSGGIIFPKTIRSGRGVFAWSGWIGLGAPPRPGRCPSPSGRGRWM